MADDAGPQLDVYALCPCEPTAEAAELVDGGVFLPYSRAKRDACLIACLEVRAREGIENPAGVGSPPSFPIVGVVALIMLVLGFLLGKL